MTRRERWKLAMRFVKGESVEAIAAKEWPENELGAGETMARIEDALRQCFNERGQKPKKRR